MPGYTDNAKNGMLGQLRGRITHLSIHTASPGSNGANEVAGGDPAYARAAVTTSDFTAASGGAFSLDEDQPFAGPAAADATHFGTWDDSTFLGGGAITGDNAFNAEGEFILKAGTSFDLNA
jgi:hypothetical protein